MSKTGDPAHAPPRAWSGRRLVLVFGPLALVGAAIVIGFFSKYGRGNFTRAARIVEARARAYELASAIARCTNRRGPAALPPPSPWVPPEPPRKLSLDAESSAASFAHEAFTCAGFSPRGEIHVQVAWFRSDDHHGAARSLLDDDGDGRPNFEAESIVECAPQGEDRCHARLVTEKRLE